MRCYCCNKQLSDREATRRFAESGMFVDMCDKCLGTLDDTLDVTDGYSEGDEHEEDSGFDRYD